MASLFDVWCQFFNYASCRAIPATDISFWGATAGAIALVIGAVYLVAMNRLA